MVSVRNVAAAPLDPRTNIGCPIIKIIIGSIEPNIPIVLPQKDLQSLFILTQPRVGEREQEPHILKLNFQHLCTVQRGKGGGKGEGVQRGRIAIHE